MNAVAPTNELQEMDWRRLIETIHQGQCILVLGPDASIENVGGIEQTLSTGLAQLLNEKLDGDQQVTDQDDLAHVAQAYLRQKNDRFELELEVGDYYKSHDSDTNDVNLNLAGLPFDLCITTAHDQYLKNAFDKKNK